MEKDKTIFYGAIKGFDEEKKTVESVVLHFDTPNENFWCAVKGSIDAFLERISTAGKGIAACYQHDERVLIGKWNEFRVEGDALIAKLFLSDTPFVRDTVIPQLKDGTLQGASPSIGASQGHFNADGIFEIVEGAIGEISLVGLPADLDANIIKIAAKIEAQKKDTFEFDLLTL